MWVVTITLQNPDKSELNPLLPHQSTLPPRSFKLETFLAGSLEPTFSCVPLLKVTASRNHISPHRFDRFYHRNNIRRTATKYEKRPTEIYRSLPAAEYNNSSNSLNIHGGPRHVVSIKQLILPATRPRVDTAVGGRAKETAWKSSRKS